MQIARFGIALVAAIAVTPLMAAQKPAATTKVAAATAAYPVAQTGAAPVQAAPQQWLNRMGDFTQNASAFKDPRTFNQWFGAMTDPSMMMAAIPVMMEPGSWIRTTSSMMQPGAVANYMAFSNPAVASRWMGAAMDPNFYMQNMGSMADPSKMMRWMMVPMDPRMMQSGMTMMDPNNYMKWMMVPMDPRVSGLMFAPMNPQLYGSMMGMANGFMPNGMQMPRMPFFGGQVPAFQPGVVTKLALAGDTLFKSDKASIKDLTPQGKASLDDLAAKMKAAGAIDTIHVTGHADKMGKASYNMRLSQARAAAVASYLKKQGVNAGKIITAGKGDTDPVVQCDAKLSKEELKTCLQPNRRVEMEINFAK